MPLDNVDKGQIVDETPEMKATREKLLSESPTPSFFKLRGQMLKQGRTGEVVADTGNLYTTLKVYASGGENGLHAHEDQDHQFIIMQGQATFYGPRGEEKELDQYEGIDIPAGCFYRFQSSGDVPLVLLRLGARLGPKATHRYNVYGDPLHGQTEANGNEEVIPIEGEYWGAAE
jgi:mannose-6-phosphate isomerase-like protein (cupin superfamily)